MRQTRRKVTDRASNLAFANQSLAVGGQEAPTGPPRERKRLIRVPASPRHPAGDRTATEIADHVGVVEYMTPEQLASMMQVSVKTVYRMVATDASLPATRFGRAVRFRTDLLERWLATRTQRSRRQTYDQRGGVTTTVTSTAA